MSDEYKMVIVTRDDLKLSPGKLAAQAAHAAVSCTLQTKQHNTKWFTKWQQEGGKKVVVHVDTEADFYPLIKKAHDLGITAELVIDAGHTEIAPGTKTVIGVGPGPSNLIDQITGKLPTL
jgi:PTH2 family peptidyl-tRNA hydrolase